MDGYGVKGVECLRGGGSDTGLDWIGRRDKG